MTHWQGYVLGDAITPKNPIAEIILNWKLQHRWPSKLALMPKHCLKGPSVDVLWVHKSARWNFEQYLTSPPGETFDNTWQVSLVNLSQYLTKVRLVNRWLWKSNQLLTCRPIWEESKDWTMDCAFHSELHYFGISSFSSSFLMFSIITWIWLCGVMYIWT